jgi:hypothetical protein
VAEFAAPHDGRSAVVHPARGAHRAARLRPARRHDHRPHPRPPRPEPPRDPQPRPRPGTSVRSRHTNLSADLLLSRLRRHRIQCHGVSRIRGSSQLGDRC